MVSHLHWWLSDHANNLCTTGQPPCQHAPSTSTSTPTTRIADASDSDDTSARACRWVSTQINWHLLTTTTSLASTYVYPPACTLTCNHCHQPLSPPVPFHTCTHPLCDHNHNPLTHSQECDAMMTKWHMQPMLPHSFHQQRGKSHGQWQSW